MSEGHAAILKITTKALTQLLRLPEGTVIHTVFQSPADYFTKTVQIMIEHPDLPAVAEGCVPPTADLRYTQGDEHTEILLLEPTHET